MESNKLFLSDEETLHYKQLITNRFIKNPRMSLLFDKNRKGFRKNVFNLVNYCFHLATRANGVHVASNKKTVVLFYENKKIRKTFSDYLRYLKVIKSIPLSNLKRVLNDEKKLKEHRIKLDNYLYVWFIAQEEGYGKLDGLIEINQMLTELSNKVNLPIVFETSDKQLISFYQRAGFNVYKELKRNDEIIYFLTDKFSPKSDDD